MKDFMNKIKSPAGESIAETLIALLIVSCGFILLATAVVAAAKVNTSIENTEVVFNISGQDSQASSAVISHGGSAVSVSTSVDVTKYVTQNGYVYYLPKEN